MSARGLLIALAAVATASAPMRAQTDVTCVPVAERAGRAFGCFITAREELGRLPADVPLYWHLDTYPTRASFSPPPGWGYSRPVVYLAWAFVVVAMYPLCRWFAALRQRRSDPWLSYL